MKCNLLLTKRVVSLLLIGMLVFAAPACFAEEEKGTEEEKLKRRSESYNGVVDIEGDTFVIYAQNSPEYSELYIGAGYAKRVRDSACASCSLANIIVNVAAFEDLPLIRNISLFPIRIDTRNVSREQGIFERYSFEIKRNEDYFRYFPLCILNVTSSNNKGIGNRYNTAGYYREFFKCLDIENSTPYDIDEAVSAVERGEAIVGICIGGTNNPLSTKHGHYLTIAKVSGDKVYFLDSIFTDTYDKDHKGMIHVQQPGVFWVNKEDIHSIGIHGSLYIAYKKENRTVYDKERYTSLIELSNIIED